jgi:hypothetical protein
MAKTLQFRRGSTAELSSVTGAVGEIFIDTTKDTVVVMDGSTAGGFPLQRELTAGSGIDITGNTISATGGSYGNAEVAAYLGTVGDNDTFVIGNDSYEGYPKVILGGTVATLQACNAVILDSVNGNVYIPTGNLTTPGIKTNNYYYANGAPVSFGGDFTTNEDGSKTLTIESGTTSSQTVFAYNYPNSGASFVLVSPGNQFRITGSNSGVNVSVFAQGATVTFSSYTLVLTSNMVWDGTNWNASCTVTSGGTVSEDIILYGYMMGSVVVSTTAIQVDVLEVAISGVTITGNITTTGIKTDNYYYANGAPVSFGGGGSGADLSQVAEDILPLFSEVYDLGSTTKRWYDAYLSNTLNINDVTLTGSAGTLTTAADVVVGSLLADQILITDNMIVPDASTATEYSGGQGVVIVDGNMDIQGDWIKVPVVETAPTTGSAGYIRYNQDTDGFEGHNGTAWGAIGGGGTTYTAGTGINITDDVISATAPPLTYATLTATGNGTTTAFFIGPGRTVHNILVFVNGLCFTPTDDYTISGSTLTFTEAPSNLAEITFRFLPI